MLFGPRRAVEFISTIRNYEDEVAEHLGSRLKVAQPLVTDQNPKLLTPAFISLIRGWRRYQEKPKGERI